MTTPAQRADSMVTVFVDPDGHFPLRTPLIRVVDAGGPRTAAAAIVAHIARTGSVFLELPDGRLTIVVTVDSEAWNPHAD